MVVAITRRPYRVTYRLRKDDETSDIRVTVTKAKTGAKELPFPTIFGDYQLQDGQEWNGIGEVPGSRTYLKEWPNPPLQDGKQYGGDESIWRDGLPENYDEEWPWWDDDGMPRFDFIALGNLQIEGDTIISTMHHPTTGDIEPVLRLGVSIGSRTPSYAIAQLRLSSGVCPQNHNPTNIILTGTHTS